MDVEQIHEAVLRERRVCRHAEQTAVPVVVDAASEVDEGIRQQTSAGDDAHHAGFLGDEHASVGQRGEGDWQREAADDRFVDEALEDAVSGGGTGRGQNGQKKDQEAQDGQHGGHYPIRTRALNRRLVMGPNVAIDREALTAFCRTHGIRRLAVFGSALRDDFGPHSDIDVPVEFEVR